MRIKAINKESDEVIVLKNAQFVNSWHYLPSTGKPNQEHVLCPAVIGIDEKTRRVVECSMDFWIMEEIVEDNEKHSDKQLLEYYMMGFNECNSGVYKKIDDPVLLRAYTLGWNDFIVGDDVSSSDLQSDAEILKRIRGNVDARYFSRQPLGINDFKGNCLFEGDIIKHPSQEEIGVIRYEKNSCQFRIQYDPKTFIPSCAVGLQMSKKEMAVKIGSIYDNPDLLGWKEN